MFIMGAGKEPIFRSRIKLYALTLHAIVFIYVLKNNEVSKRNCNLHQGDFYKILNPTDLKYIS